MYKEWTYAYFKSLIVLRNILLDNLEYESSPEDMEYFKSEEFFRKFCGMIYRTSSKRIARYTEELSSSEEDLYFTIFGI
jgi:hypothetical protein